MYSGMDFKRVVANSGCVDVFKECRGGVESWNVVESSRACSPSGRDGACGIIYLTEAIVFAHGPLGAEFVAPQIPRVAFEAHLGVEVERFAVAEIVGDIFFEDESGVEIAFLHVGGGDGGTGRCNLQSARKSLVAVACRRLHHNAVKP